IYNKKGTPKTVEVHGDLKLGGTVAYIGLNTGALPISNESWTPDLISPLLWFDASTDITTDGNKVTAWESRSTGNFTAVQSNDDKRPLYQTGINGLNTVNFDGVDDFLTVSHQPSLNLPAN